MSDKKAGFIALIIMLLFIAVACMAALLIRGFLTYICYLLSVFGILWLYRAAYNFIRRDDRSAKTGARR